MTQFIQKQFNNFHGKTKFKKDLQNLFWNAANNLLNGLFTLFFTPIFLKILGITDYAFINIWLTLNSLILILDLGVNLTINKLIASKDETLIAKKKWFSSFEANLGKRIFLLNIITLGLGIIFLIWITTVSRHYIITILILILSSSFQFLVQYYTNVFLGLLLHKKINRINILFTFVKFGLGLSLVYYLPNIIGFAVLQLIISIIQWKYLKFQVYHHLDINLAQISPEKNFTKSKNNDLKGFTLLSIASIILLHLDKVWATSNIDISYYSKYAVAITGANALHLIIQPLYKTFFPRYSCNSKNNKLILTEQFIHSSTLSSILLILVSISFYQYSETILRLWLGTNYSSDINNHFNIAVIGIGISGIFWLPAAFLQVNNKHAIHNNAIIISIIISIVLVVIDWVFKLDISPAIVWVIHALTLVIYEGIFFFRASKKSVVHLLWNGILLPLCIFTAVEFFFIHAYESKDVFRLVIVFIISLSLNWIYATKTKSLNEAFS